MEHSQINNKTVWTCKRPLPNGLMQRCGIDNKCLQVSKYIALVICWGVFYAVYTFAASYAASLKEVSSLCFSFEKAIPFVPFAIYFYSSSVVFFIWVFFLCNTFRQLSTLSKRIVFITVLSGICFIIFPLKQSFVRPETAHILFSVINTYDTPFNQAPSLHIGYACIFWSGVRNSRFRNLLRMWLVLLMLSTLLVYQHHFIDITTGLMAGFLTLWMFPYRKKRNQQIATVYFFLPLWG